jgi:arylsulfatase A-like enzyme
MTMASRDRQKPDFLIVLFDCLRAEDFPGGIDPVPGMPFAEELMGQSIVFPRAVSPAPWTIPSHASLFTGLYPWENQVHAYRSLSLGDSIPTLAETLKPLGYRSLSLSANPFVSPRFGLVRGFDESGWGGWWEAFFRTPRDRAPNFQHGGAAETALPQDRTMEWVRDGPLGDVLRSASQQSFRFPFGLDAGSRLLQKLRFPEVERNISQTPWIEPELQRWLGERPTTEPVLTFLNLTDTHEPYYPDPAYVHGLREWWALTRVRQDHANAVGGEWLPTENDSRRLRELYRQMVRHLDDRLRAIVRALQDTGRWENTVMFVTADHGQSLGEHGMMFHLLRLDEPLIRIPLWMRPVGGGGGGRRARGWASLIDLFPTIVQAAGGYPPNLPSAVPLNDLIDHERPNPVFAMADGIVWDHIRKRFGKDREQVWDRPLVAAYARDLKVLMTANGDEARAFNVEKDPKEEHDLLPSEPMAVADLTYGARKVGAALLQNGANAIDPEIEARLRSWGYV